MKSRTESTSLLNADPEIIKAKVFRLLVLAGGSDPGASSLCRDLLEAYNIPTSIRPHLLRIFERLDQFEFDAAVVDLQQVEEWMRVNWK